MKRLSWRSACGVLAIAALVSIPALAEDKKPAPAAVPAAPVLVNVELVTTDLRNQLASHSRQIEKLIMERDALAERLDGRREDKDRALQALVVRQEKLVAVAEEQREALEELGNQRRLFRLVTGAGVRLYRLPDLMLGQAVGTGASPRDPEPARLDCDVFGGVAFLPVDLNGRDRRQTFSLGGLVGLGGSGFPTNVYAGLTLKVWILYLNAGLNLRKEGEGSQWALSQPPTWRGAWTPSLFTGISLDSDALLAIQRALPAKSAPEGLDIDPG